MQNILLNEAEAFIALQAIQTHRNAATTAFETDKNDTCKLAEKLHAFTGGEVYLGTGPQLYLLSTKSLIEGESYETVYTDNPAIAMTFETEAHLDSYCIAQEINHYVPHPYEGGFIIIMGALDS